MSMLLLQIEDEDIAIEIREFIARFKSVKIQEIDSEIDCEFNEANFIQTLKEIKNGDALKSAKPIDELFYKMENEWSKLM